MNQNVSYYAIIPANVRYDIKICPNAKLLYSEVTALCNKEGYCWATNKYFADLYGVSTRTITNWIKQLTDNGYLESEIIYKADTKEIAARYLRLPSAAHQLTSTPSEENQAKEETTDPMENNFYTPMETGEHHPTEDFFYTPPENNFHTPMEKNFQYNNKNINNTSINILSFKDTSKGKKEEIKREENGINTNVGTKGAECPIPDLSDLKLDDNLLPVIELIKSMICQLWDMTAITVKGKSCNQQYIRAQLSRLTSSDVQTVLEKFRANRDKINNLPSYLASMLLQAPDETALWKIKKTGTPEATLAFESSYDIDEWERQTLFKIQTK